MDSNRSSLIGTILLTLLAFAFLMYINVKRGQQAPPDQVTEQTTDSTTTDATPDTEPTTETVAPVVDTTAIDSTGDIDPTLRMRYGIFAPLMQGEAQTHTLENDVLALTISSRGGRIVHTRLKGLETYGGDSLILIDSTYDMNLHFGSVESKGIDTRDIRFVIHEASSDRLVLRAEVGGGFLEFRYGLQDSSYMVNMDMRFMDMQAATAPGMNTVRLELSQDALNQEKDIQKERQFSLIMYRERGEKIHRTNPRKEDTETFEEDVSWVAFKQQFFNTTWMVNGGGFTGGTLSTSSDASDSTIVKHYEANLTLPYRGGDEVVYDMDLLMGPNDLKLFQEYGEGLEDLLHQRKFENFFLFRWITRGLIIPLFRFLEGSGLNYGLIILIMTLVIKLILSPLTVRSYMSQAKMKVLQPELAEIKEKHKGDQQKQSQAQMKLYASAGVNPMGGCLPMLLQMPFLLAMFYFFPSSIELRGESFLWANDLSTYDAIISWKTPLPIIGMTHLSLFTLLMSISQIIYAKTNSQMSGAPSQPGMEAMKYMPYIFPVFLFFLFNSWASALTYYYFLSNVITFGQQIIIKQFFIDEDKIHAELKEKAKKPKKKSGWMARMEEAYKMQQQMQEQKKKGSGGKRK